MALEKHEATAKLYKLLHKHGENILPHEERSVDEVLKSIDSLSNNPDRYKEMLDL